MVRKSSLGGSVTPLPASSRAVISEAVSGSGSSRSSSRTLRKMVPRLKYGFGFRRRMATAASVGVSTVRDFEAGRRTPMVNNLKAIQADLERRGIRFFEENGACGVAYALPAYGKA